MSARPSATPLGNTMLYNMVTTSGTIAISATPSTTFVTIPYDPPYYSGEFELKQEDMAGIPATIKETKLGLYIQSVLDETKDLKPTDEELKTLKVMKQILNESFGEERNQIVPPSANKEEDFWSLLALAGWQIRPEDDTNESYRSHFMREDVLRSAKTHLEGNKKGRYTVYIHFPKVKITNARKQSLDLTDLYVKFVVNLQGKFLDTIEGLRSSVTREQFDARYFHSHLPVFDPMNIRFRPFCLGTGPLQEIILVLRDKFDEVSFRLFCLNLGTYVEYESIEGRPHTYLEGVISQGGGPIEISGSMGEAALNYLTNTILNNKEGRRGLFNISVKPNVIQFDPTDELEKTMARILIEYYKSIRYDVPTAEQQRWIVYKTPEGVYYNASRVRRNASDNPRFTKETLLVFKGQEIHFNIISNEKENEKEQTREYYANPSFTKELCEFLTFSCTKSAIRNEGAGSASSPVRDNPVITTSDPVVVPAGA